MTFLEIEAFLNIVKHGSFSAAAEKLFVTQPALGRRVRALEEELGYPLFVRAKGIRHVELTKQGQAFISLAERWQALWNETQEEALLGHANSFYVASVGSVQAFLLPAVFHGFMKRNPDCSLHVTTAHSSDAYGYVGKQGVDVAFISDTMYSSQICTQLLFREDLCLVIGKELDYPDTVKIADLNPRQEIRTQWDQNFETWHSYYFGSAAMPKIYLDEMGFLQYFIQNGDNWAFLPVSIARHMLRVCGNAITVHELDVKPPQRSIYVLYRKHDISPYQSELLSLCRDALQREEGIWLAEDAGEDAGL